MSNAPAPPSADRWYAGITRYQWLVLVIASLGWVFDVFEGQIFVASMNEAMRDLVDGADIAAEQGLTDPDEIADAVKGRIAFYNQFTLALFLLGGAIGGILFGMLSDRIGRKRTMSFTIAFYSVFTCISAFSAEWWHLAGLRFLVAMGVGGEWAVASALVAEVFPDRARARVGGIFHASSVLGTYLAVAAGALLIGNQQLQLFANAQNMPTLPWRIGFAIGVLPALLIVWIRISLREPESWQQARDLAATDRTKAVGSMGELFSPTFLRQTLVGVTLATVGLATFWGAHIYGKDLLKLEVNATWNGGLPEDVLAPTVAAVRRDLLESEEPPEAADLDASLATFESSLRTGRHGEILEERRLRTLDPLDKRVGRQLRATVDARLKRWEMLGMFLTTTGGGIGLLLFGPLCEWIGRRGAFLWFHVGGFVAALVTLQWVTGVWPMIAALPVFGFLTLGMHAGYAIYFPELYPTRLRGTGAGFCFNAGRILVPPLLILIGWMQNTQGLSVRQSATILSGLFLAGLVVLLFAPETKGRELPE
jgi:MFS family permease